MKESTNPLMKFIEDLPDEVILVEALQALFSGDHEVEAKQFLGALFHEALVHYVSEERPILEFIDNLENPALLQYNLVLDHELKELEYHLLDEDVASAVDFSLPYLCKIFDYSPYECYHVYLENWDEETTEASIEPLAIQDLGRAHPAP